MQIYQTGVVVRDKDAAGWTENASKIITIVRNICIMFVKHFKEKAKKHLLFNWKERLWKLIHSSMYWTK